MKKYSAEINVMLHPEILDPQGKAVSSSLTNLGLSEIKNVRIGKHMSLEVTAENRETAENMVDQACKKLLANLVMERYSFELIELN